MQTSSMTRPIQKLCCSGVKACVTAEICFQFLVNSGNSTGFVMESLSINVSRKLSGTQAKNCASYIDKMVLLIHILGYSISVCVI